MGRSRQIIVTGSAGQMGQSLKSCLSKKQSEDFLFTDRSSLDITNEKQLQTLLKDTGSKTLINFAAYTAVDDAETDKDSAYEINTRALEVIGRTCKENGVNTIHISTDYVYHNQLNRPLKETDVCMPQTVYGKSKLEGEKLLFANNPNTIILRCSWIYSEYGKNFLKTMCHLMGESRDLKVVYDQVGCPSYAVDLAEAILEISQKNKLSDFAGIYNLANKGVASWYDFALAIKELGNYQSHVTAVESFEFPTAAARPNYSIMNLANVESTFQLKMKPWQLSLRAAFQRLNDFKTNY